MHLVPKSLDIILKKWFCKAFVKNLGTFIYQSEILSPYGGNLKDFWKPRTYRLNACLDLKASWLKKKKCVFKCLKMLSSQSYISLFGKFYIGGKEYISKL